MDTVTISHLAVWGFGLHLQDPVVVFLSPACCYSGEPEVTMFR